MKSMHDVPVSLSRKISNASVFAMMMVVAIHVTNGTLTGVAKFSSQWWLDSLLHYGVCRIAVPFFFCCSGYFLAGHMEDSGWWKRETLKRIRSLMVPYVIWSLVFAVVIPCTMRFLANLVHGRNLFHGMNLLLGQGHEFRFWVDVFGLHPGDWPGLGPLWYVRALFMFIAISPLLRYFVKRCGNWILVVIFCLLMFHQIHGLEEQDRCYWMLTRFFSISGLFYFCCGIYARMHNASITQRNCHISLIMGLVLLFAKLYFHGKAVVCFTPFVTPLLLIGFWGMIPDRPLPKWLTRTTFPVFLMHIPLWDIVGYFIPLKVEGGLTWIMKWAVGFFGSVVVALLLQRFFKKGSNIVFGGR